MGCSYAGISGGQKEPDTPTPNCANEAAERSSIPTATSRERIEKVLRISPPPEQSVLARRSFLAAPETCRSMTFPRKTIFGWMESAWIAVQPLVHHKHTLFLRSRTPTWSTVCVLVSMHARSYNRKKFEGEMVTPESASAKDRAPRRRWGIALLLGFCVLVNYFDRVNLSISQDALHAAFGISAVTFGYLLSAYSWTYAALQLPSGLLLDRFGVKLVGRVGALLWSV